MGVVYPQGQITQKALNPKASRVVAKRDFNKPNQKASASQVLVLDPPRRGLALRRWVQGLVGGEVGLNPYHGWLRLFSYLFFMFLNGFVDDGGGGGDPRIH